MGEEEGCDLGMKQSPEESGLGGCTGPNTMEGVGVEEKERGEMGLGLGQGVKPGQGIGKV